MLGVKGCRRCLGLFGSKGEEGGGVQLKISSCVRSKGMRVLFLFQPFDRPVVKYLDDFHCTC